MLNAKQESFDYQLTKSFWSDSTKESNPQVFRLRGGRSNR